MDRPELDRFSARHRLDAAAIGAALALTGNRPDARAWRRFAADALHAAGLGALGAGIIFFVAANWQAWGLMGRFALLQAGVLGSVAVALWRPPPQRTGQGALLLATLFTGGALALFGQSYQTGADVYELFFTWAALTLPFALGALSGAEWALWWGILNAGLALLFGTLGLDHVIWRVLGGGNFGRAHLLMLPCVIDLIGAGAFLLLRRTRWAAAAPLWLVRLLTALGLAFGTAAALPFMGRDGHAPLALFTLLSIAIGAATWHARRDVFPMTLLAASWITLSTAWLIHALRLNDVGEFFLVALWLIGASTAAGMLLMHWWRTWRLQERASNPGAPQ